MKFENIEKYKNNKVKRSYLFEERFTSSFCDYLFEDFMFTASGFINPCGYATFNTVRVNSSNMEQVVNCHQLVQARQNFLAYDGTYPWICLVHPASDCPSSVHYYSNYNKFTTDIENFKRNKKN